MNFDAPHFALMRAQLLDALPLEERKRRGLAMAERAATTEHEMKQLYKPPTDAEVAAARARVQELGTKLLAASKSKSVQISTELKAAREALVALEARKASFDKQAEGTRMHKAIGMAAWLDAMERKFPS